MKIYHSSDVVVCRPDTIHSREYLDFGKGFYLTTLYEQAERYAQRFLRRKKTAWINVYELDESWEIGKCCVLTAIIRIGLNSFPSVGWERP